MGAPTVLIEKLLSGNELTSAVKQEEIISHVRPENNICESHEAVLLLFRKVLTSS